MSRPELSDEAKARIRAEEEARIQARLEEEYRHAVRAELERQLAAERAPTDVERPALTMPGAPIVRVPSSGGAGGERSERVRILPALDAHASRAEEALLPAADGGASSPVAPRPSTRLARRSRLWWAALVCGLAGLGALVVALVGWPRPSSGAGEMEREVPPSGVIVLGGEGELRASDLLDEGDGAGLAGEDWRVGADGRIEVVPRPPITSPAELAREHAEEPGRPRWPVPDNPPLEQIYQRIDESPDGLIELRP